MIVASRPCGHPRPLHWRHFVAAAAPPPGVLRLLDFDDLIRFVPVLDVLLVEEVAVAATAALQDVVLSAGCVERAVDVAAGGPGRAVDEAGGQLAASKTGSDVARAAGCN